VLDSLEEYNSPANTSRGTMFQFSRFNRQAEAVRC
jgi:hypothetical protein